MIEQLLAGMRVIKRESPGRAMQDALSRAAGQRKGWLTPEEHISLRLDRPKSSCSSLDTKYFHFH